MQRGSQSFVVIGDPPVFQQTETDINQGTIHICKNRDENNPLYPSNLLQVPGIKEFLNLSYFHLIHASTGDNERQRIIREYQYLENYYFRAGLGNRRMSIGVGLDWSFIKENNARLDYAFVFENPAGAAHIFTYAISF